MSEFPSKTEFEQAVGSEFLMEVSDGLFAPALLKRCLSKADTPLQECFSLIFVAPADVPSEQMLRRVRHAELGEMSIFLVPVKQDATGLHFEAVFNRLRV